MTKNSQGMPSDLDIMMFLDGELSGDQAKAVEAYLGQDPDAGAKATSLGQMSELIAVSTELEADDAEAKLGQLWSGIESGIAAQAQAPRPAAQAAEERATQALVAKSSWFAGWQGHLMTGSFVAVAVAVLMLATRPDPTQAPDGQVAARQQVPVAIPVALSSQDPEVEELEVYDGDGVVMTIPADSDQEDNATTVIWISNDTDVVEDPI